MARLSRFEVDLALASQMANAARRTAVELDALVTVAIVDAGGHLLVLERMDGAEIAGPVLARDKAYTAVAHRIATAELTSLAAPGGELAGMHSADGGRYITFSGGLPVWDDGRVIAGIGVSGGTGAQDAACAAAAFAFCEKEMGG